MPEYLYECETCGRELEITHSIHRDAYKSILHTSETNKLRDCTGPMKRLITGAPAVVWKGGAPTPKTYE